MQQAALYIRVSTDDQLEYSPDAQKNALMKYAKDNDLFIDPKYIFIDEGISGRKAEKRPAFMEMIATAKGTPKPFDFILVHKFDRFARNREDSVVYKSLLKKEYDIKVISITESIEDDKFAIILESMLEAMAEYYSLNLADEVKKGMNEKARRGEHIGTVPYGYLLKDKQLIPYDNEFPAVQKAFEMHSSGSSLLEIARYLNTHNFTTKLKKPWTKHSLRYLLKNPVYAGFTRYNYRNGKTNKINPESEWILTKAGHSPAVSESNFNKSQEIFKNNTVMRRTESDPKNIKSWIQKLARCSHCGSTLRVHHVTRKGVRYNYFRCDKAYQGGCDVTKTYSARKLAKIIYQKIESDLSLGNIQVTAIKSATQLDELDALNNRLQKLQRQYELIYQSYIAEIDSLDEYKKNKQALTTEEEEIMSLIEQASKKEDVSAFKTIQVENFKSILLSDEFSEYDKHKAAKQFIEKIDIDLLERKLDIYYYM